MNDPARPTELLKAIVERFGSVRDAEALAEAVEEEISAIVAVEYEAFYLYDEKLDTLSLIRARGFTETERAEAERTAMARHPGWVIRNRKILDIPDTRMDPRSADSPRSFQIRSRLFCPLLLADKCYGTVGLAASRPKAFTNRHRELLSFVSAVAALACENIQHTRNHADQATDRYRKLVESANDGMVIIEETGNVAYVNRVLSETLDTPERDIVNKPFWRFVHDEDVDRTMQAYFRAQQGQDSRNMEVRLIRADKQTVPFEANVVPHFINGRFAGGFTVLRDLTQRKKTEAELEQSRRHLKDTERIDAIGRLAGGVAHDFNNLLTIIVGQCELVMACLDKDDVVRRDIAQIRAAGEKAASLTSRLLTFSRRQTLRLRILNLNDALAETTAMLRRLIGEDVEITLDGDPRLEPVRADPTYVGQVIMNLAVNARDAMPAGGKIRIETRNVSLSVEQCAGIPDARPGRYVRLAIVDNGVGMDKATMDRIFEPFFTTKTTGTGTGLGLSMVYGAVKQHDGWISVESEPGRGSRFEIYLPALDPAQKVDLAAPAPRARLQGEGQRILLVEDDGQLQTFTARVLNANGYSVTAASTCAEALDIFDRREDGFDLVFTDVVLPDRSGVVLAAEIINRRPDVPLLLTSGYTADRSQRDTIKDMCLPFLQKPYGVGDLLAAIRDALDRAED